ncbi:MAG TPA: electron transfer flavoprotein subunit alpha, partial [Clostridiales bacterium]|nr:electron transfer flavoprotein subunit alpha [Clostridiales bacterium]
MADLNINAETNTAAYRGIWVFAEQQENRIHPAAFELLGKGRELADARRCPLTALLFGAAVAGQTDGLITAGADEVLLCEHESLADNLDDPYTDLITALVSQRKPEILLLGATDFGRSLAPRVSARLKTGLTADCTELGIDAASGLLQQTRPAFGGNLMATILTARHRPQMATVRPGVFTAARQDPQRRGCVIPVSPPQFQDRITLLSQELAGPKAGIADAEIIVSAGRGIGAQKNLVLVKKLADLLGGSYGVSRPLVDMGWSDGNHQIGQTGQAVSPRLLIACGISGAIQHLAG